jgi:hypothetical protein
MRRALLHSVKRESEMWRKITKFDAKVMQDTSHRSDIGMLSDLLKVFENANGKRYDLLASTPVRGPVIAT